MMNTSAKTEECGGLMGKPDTEQGHTTTRAREWSNGVKKEEVWLTGPQNKEAGKTKEAFENESVGPLPCASP
jgi:hypothetical protein